MSNSCPKARSLMYCVSNLYKSTSLSGRLKSTVSVPRQLAETVGST